MKTDLSLATVIALLLPLGACSSQPAAPSAEPSASTPSDVAATPSPTATTPPVAAAPTPASRNTLTLEGLGDLRIGQAVPSGGAWASRGAQTSDACRTISNPAYPGVYAIVTDGKVGRITLGQRSDVKLTEGIGVGASEKEVGKWFAGFRAEPHKYEEAPAKYLTAPNAASGDPALRFEIGQDGKVKLIHVGTMPTLGYVEGCS